MNRKKYKRQMARNFKRNPGMRRKYATAMREMLAKYPAPKGHLHRQIMSWIGR